MRIAITGGTGFVGSHLAERLAQEGNQVLLLARGLRPISLHTGIGFERVDITDYQSVRAAVAGVDAIAHCAGINREVGGQTYQAVHVEATRNILEAAQAAGVRKIVFMSFLRARPNCGSAYHESKWQAEEIVRNSGVDYTIVKAGMVYGSGDHMLDHLSHAFFTLPLLATVGLQTKHVRPLAIGDLVDIMRAALVDQRLNNQTVAVLGPEKLSLDSAVHRVSRVVNRRVWTFPAPLAFHYLLAQILEWSMKVPLIAKAQVRILSEGVSEPVMACDPLPEDLRPKRSFTEDQIRGGLPEPGPFGLRDLRCCLRDA